MKKFAILSITLFLVSGLGFAGTKDDAFNEAISNGLHKNSCYSIDNIGKKEINVKSMVSYIIKKDYVVTIVESDSNGNLLRLDFTKRNNLPHFMHYAMSMRTEVKPLKTIGKVCLPVKDPIYKPGALRGSKPIRYEDNIGDEFSNVLWTGELNGEYIEGTGSGICTYANGDFTYFEGTFLSGIPASETVLKYYIQKDSPYMVGDLSDITVLNFAAISPEKLDIKTRWSSVKLRDPIKACLASYGTDKAEEYIKEAKQILLSGKTPNLNRSIIGSLGLINPTYIFKANEDAENVYFYIEPLSKYNVKAKEAFNYMLVLDALYLSSIDNAQKARDYLFSGSFEYINQSGYFSTLKKAIAAIDDLKKTNSSNDINSQLTKAKTIISEWYNVINTDRESIKKKRNDALWNSYNKLMAEVLSSSGGSGSSSYSSGEDLNVENLNLSDFEYDIDKDWHTSLGDIVLTTNTKYKEVMFYDKRGKSYKGRVYHSDKDNTYYVNINGPYYKTMEDAIIASYALEKYGKTRKKGSN